MVGLQAASEQGLAVSSPQQGQAQCPSAGERRGSQGAGEEEGTGVVAISSVGVGEGVWPLAEGVGRRWSMHAAVCQKDAVRYGWSGMPVIQPSPQGCAPMRSCAMHLCTPMHLSASHAPMHAQQCCRPRPASGHQRPQGDRKAWGRGEARGDREA